MPAGRPSGYDPIYCDAVIEWGKLGKSRAWIAAELDVVRDTLANWEKAHPEFLCAMERARLAAQRWWEDRGQSNLEAQNFQAAMWSRSMAARFPDDWRETKRNENTGPDGGPQQHVVDTYDAFTRRITGLAARAAETSGNSETEPS